MLDFFLFFPDSTLTCFEIGQQVFEGFILFGQVCSGIIDDVIRKAKLSCDGKRITLSRDTDQKTVSRTERLDIKFTTGILNTWCGKSEDFQLTVVSSCHGADPSLMEIA